MTRSAKASPFRLRQQSAYSPTMDEGYPREKSSRNDQKKRRQKAHKGGRFNPDMTRRHRFGAWDDAHDDSPEAPEADSPTSTVPALPHLSCFITDL